MMFMISVIYFGFCERGNVTCVFFRLSQMRPFQALKGFVTRVCYFLASVVHAQGKKRHQVSSRRGADGVDT